jgi:hypothetical protein
MPYGDAWFRFRGTVRDSTGMPIEGVVLRIAANGVEKATAISTTDGTFSFVEPSCPCDFAFELTAEKPGYAKYSFTAGGRTANRLRIHDIVLKPGG